MVFQSVSVSINKLFANNVSVYSRFPGSITRRNLIIGVRPAPFYAYAVFSKTLLIFHTYYYNQSTIYTRNRQTMYIDVQKYELNGQKQISTKETKVPGVLKDWNIPSSLKIGPKLEIPTKRIFPEMVVWVLLLKPQISRAQRTHLFEITKSFDQVVKV